MRAAAKGCLPLLCGVAAVCFGADAQGLLYVGAWPKQVLVIDEAQQKVVGHIPLSTGTPQGLGISNDRTKLFVTTWIHDGIEVIDLASRRVTNSFALDEPNRRVFPSGLASDPQDRLLYTTVEVSIKQIDRFEREPRKFAVIDLTQRKIARTAEYPKEEENVAAMFADHRVSPDGKYLYEFRDSVFIFDTSDFKLVEKIEFAKPRAPGMELMGLASTNDPMDPPGMMTALFNASDPVVHRPIFGIARVDLSNRNFEFTAIGPAPKGMSGVHITPDGKTGYAAVTEDGPPGNRRSEFWVFDVPSRKVVKRVEFPARTRYDFALSSSGKQIYIYTAGPTIEIFDAGTLQLQKTINLDADVTTNMVVVPARKS